VASLVSLQRRATLAPAAAMRADLPLLLVPGWYLTAAKQFDLVASPLGF